jgi:hypothetical protein
MTKSSKAKLAYQAEYNARPENVKKRVKNNAARQEAMDKGLVKKGDGKDVAHKTALDNGGGNTPGNTVVQDRSTNRAWRKGQSGYRVPNKK